MPSLALSMSRMVVVPLLTFFVGEEPAPPPEKKGRRRSFILKDVRVFLNTLSRGIEVMKQGGIGADMKREETADALILTISIPKARDGQAENAAEAT